LNVEVAVVERGATIQVGGNRVEATGTLDIDGTLEQPDVADVWPCRAAPFSSRSPRFACDAAARSTWRIARTEVRASTL
jgi:hypothetical protein